MSTQEQNTPTLDGHSASVIIDQRLKIKGQAEEISGLYTEVASLKETVKQLLPIAERCYRFYKRNGRHPDFLDSIFIVLLDAKSKLK